VAIEKVNFGCGCMDEHLGESGGGGYLADVGRRRFEPPPLKATPRDEGVGSLGLMGLPTRLRGSTGCEFLRCSSVESFGG
jgi:hypothetical protein